MSNVKKSFEAKVPGIIKQLALRNMEGFYYPDCESLVADILTKIPAGASVTWGGSESVKECGLMDALKKGDYQLLDRSVPKTAEERKIFYSKQTLADVFLMSTNAITYDGELINIDGNGNRLACMMQGPDQVFIIVGMNKFVATIDDGIHRIEHIAAPANTARLQKDTPCAATGHCGHCFTNSICSHTVITRRFGQPDRAKVFIVGENLGY